MTEDRKIDLRSDTVTRPTPEMRKAMAEAEVGDDVFLEDPTVTRLEDVAAETFQTESALFVPTGTMGNQIAVNVHTAPGDEAIVETRSHIFNYELGAMSALSGVVPRPVAGDGAILEAKDVEAAIRPDIYYLPRTGLICLENTHNMAGGRIFPSEKMEPILDLAHERGIPVHLDGARIFNAAAATGESVAELSSRADSVMFCLSKGLGAPIGSLILGDANFITAARTVRKRFGGGMRQVGVLAAAGMIALTGMPDRLPEDHESARAIAERIADSSTIDIDPTTVQTNIIIFGVNHNGWDAPKLTLALEEKGVLAVPLDRTHIRLVTHYDVSRTDCLYAADLILEFTKNKS
ncbi:MAG: GntG family PLP-dependent aldolase [Planctomycetota bacterium]|nr:GntG family PLP-dependent aldolase [Planctomycetota bacterium]